MSEQLHRFGIDAHLCGVLNMPPSAVPSGGRPAVIFITAGLLHKPGPFRLYVELSRTLAAMGIPALRFDLSGIGESGRSRTGESAEQSSVTDVREAMDSLAEELGTRRFVLTGLCSGAEVAHRAASQDTRVCAVVAMDGYMVRTPAYYWWHYLPRVFSARKWLDFAASKLQRLRAGGRRRMESTPEEEALAFWEGPGPDRDQLVMEFKSLCQRNVRQLQIFSGGSGDCSYEGQFRDAFKDVDFGELLDVCFFPEADHLYVLQTDRRRLLRTITRWLGKHFIDETVPDSPRISVPRSRQSDAAVFMPNVSSSMSNHASNSTSDNLSHSVKLAGRRHFE
ncbi:MAG TPA: alpha/beta hydrolase [Gammaproteobacteria bacterium]